MNKQHIKYCLDIIMTICFICIMKIMITGMMLHERLGIIILGLVIMHIVLNYKWIKGVALKIFDKKFNTVTKFSVVLNIVLAVLTILAVVSGVFVSVTMLRGITVGNRQLWAAIHKQSALLIFICISIHIGLHWKMIMFGFKNMFKLKNSSAIRGYLLRIVSIIIMLFGLLCLSNNSILQSMLRINSGSAHKEVTKVKVIAEYVSIMGLFIGGTHYTLQINNKNIKKKAD